MKQHTRPQAGRDLERLTAQPLGLTVTYIDAKFSGATCTDFSNTSGERVSLSRQRFFEEGELPSGLVPDFIVQS